MLRQSVRKVVHFVQTGSVKAALSRLAPAVAGREPLARTDKRGIVMDKEPKQMPNTDLSDAVEYTRRIYDSNMDWYKNADTKAEIILSLDGIFLAFVISSIFMKQGDLLEILESFTVWTWLFFGLMFMALAGSILCAIACLWSRIPLTKRRRDQYLAKRNIRVDKQDTYLPEVTFFFQKISWLNSDLYQKLLLSTNKRFEIEALATDVHVLAGNVVKKHRLVDFGFFLTGISLLLFLAAGVSYLLAFSQP